MEELKEIAMITKTKAKRKETVTPLLLWDYLKCFWGKKVENLLNPAELSLGS